MQDSFKDASCELSQIDVDSSVPQRKNEWYEIAPKISGEIRLADSAWRGE